MMDELGSIEDSTCRKTRKVNFVARCGGGAVPCSCIITCIASESLYALYKLIPNFNLRRSDWVYPDFRTTTAI